MLVRSQTPALIEVYISNTKKSIESSFSWIDVLQHHNITVNFQRESIPEAWYSPCSSIIMLISTSYPCQNVVLYFHSRQKLYRIKGKLRKLWVPFFSPNPSLIQTPSILSIPPLIPWNSRNSSWNTLESDWNRKKISSFGSYFVLLFHIYILEQGNWQK